MQSKTFQKSVRAQKTLESLALRAGFVDSLMPREEDFSKTRSALDAEFESLCKEEGQRGHCARKLARSAHDFEAASLARAEAEEKNVLLAAGRNTSSDSDKSSDTTSETSDSSNSNSESDDFYSEDFSSDDQENASADGKNQEHNETREELYARLALEAKRAASAESMRKLREARRLASGAVARPLSTSVRAVKAREARKRARENANESLNKSRKK